MSNELDNQLPQGAEEEIVDNEEVNLPDLSDVGSLQQEFMKNAPAASNPLMKVAENVSGAMEDAAVNVRDFIDNNLQGDQRSKEYRCMGARRGHTDRSHRSAILRQVA